jgi:hypothetical protein
LLSGTILILKGYQTRTITVKVGLIWLSNFRGEDLDVKSDDGRRSCGGKHTHELWSGELKRTRREIIVDEKNT